MKGKLFLLVALLIGGVAGSWIKNLPGFVIVAYGDKTFEMRLWIAVSLVFSILSYTLFNRQTNSFIHYWYWKIKDWAGNRHWRKARKLTLDGMLAFAEGRWVAAESSMNTAAKKSDTKLINYLIAAQAAQHQHAEVRRDAYLRHAHEAEPNAKMAIGLTQAQLQIENQQFEQALATLNELKTRKPNHPYVLEQITKIFQQLQDWKQLYELLPNLKKNKVFDEPELTEIQHQAVSGVLNQLSNEGKPESLKDFWSNMPAAFRKQKENIVTYVELLVNANQMDEAEKLLKPIVKKQADENIVELYGKINSSHVSKQFSFLESWNNSQKLGLKTAHLSLGKLAFAAELWGKAKSNLEHAIQTHPTTEAYWFMAQTLLKLNEENEANLFFQQGLALANNTNSNLPMLSLPEGSDDIVSANLIPKLEKEEVVVEKAE